MESGALEEWLTTPVIRLEKGVDVIAWWSVNLANGHPLAQMALDFLSIPGKCLFSVVVKVSPRVSQKRLRFGDDVGAHNFIKFAKKYYQQQEEECASVGRIIVCAMSPPRLADIGILLQEAEEASRA